MSFLIQPVFFSMSHAIGLTFCHKGERAFSQTASEFSMCSAESSVCLVFIKGLLEGIIKHGLIKGKS